jgi:hypothetical protein
MTEGTRYFGPKEQKLHRRFAVDTCLRVHRSGDLESTVTGANNAPEIPTAG